MTVPIETTRNEYTGDGVLTSYPYTFRILDKAHIAVYVDDLIQTEGSHYTVTGVALAAGGNIVFTSGSIPAVDAAIVLMRNVPYTQETDYFTGVPLDEATVENDLDKVVMLAQQLKEIFERCPKFATSSLFKDIAFPDLEASKFLAVNSLGNGFSLVPGTPFLAPTFLDGSAFSGQWYDSSTYASINAAVAAIGVTNALLVVSTPETLTANLTVPANIHLVIQKGGSIIKASTYTLTINGSLFVAPYLMFSGFLPGNVTIAQGAADRVYVEMWGAGTAEDSNAFKCALATYLPVYALSLNYYIGAQLDLLGNALHMSDWTSLKFDGLGTAPGIITRAATTGSRKAEIHGGSILPIDWSGCAGCGMDIEGPIIMRKVNVTKWPRSNAIFHWNGTSSGPWGSDIQNCLFTFAGEDGVIFGTGSGSMTWINNNCKWNGSPAYGIAPSVAGTGDGLRVDSAEFFAGYNGGPYASLNVEGWLGMGGDYSYNSGYGWNISELNGCFFIPYYAEGNLKAGGYQARLYRNYNTFISSLIPANQDLYDVTGYMPDASPSCSYFLGGKFLGADKVSSFILNTVPASYLGIDPTSANYVFLVPDNVNGKARITPGGAGELIIGSPTATHFKVDTTRAHIMNLVTFADNAAFLAAGGTAGMLYMTPTGQVMVGY